MTSQPPHGVPVRSKIPGASKAATFRQLARISDESTRNLLRGVIAGASDRTPPVDAINRLRRTAHTTDLAFSIQVMLGEDGAFPFSNLGGTNRNLLRHHSLNDIPVESELAFVSGHLNGWKKHACAAIAVMGEFARLQLATPLDAINALATFIDSFGASSYAVRKLAYIMSRYGDDAELQPTFKKISDRLGQSQYPAPYFVAMELLDDDFPFFSGASTRVQIHQKFAEGDFRQLLALHDIVAVPLSRRDLGAHLRKSHSMSLVDETVSVICVHHLRNIWPDLYRTVRDLLHPDLVGALDGLGSIEFDPSNLYSDTPALNADLVYYRRSTAFIEFEACAKYRAYVDAVLAARIMRSCPPESGPTNWTERGLYG